MSLIHQALKKLEGARRGRPQAEPGPARSVSSPGTRKVNAVLIAVFIAAVGGGLAAYSYLGLGQKTDDRMNTTPEKASARRVQSSAVQGASEDQPEARPESRDGKAGPGESTHAERGMIFFRAGDYPRAATEFRAAAGSEPSNPVHHNNLGLALFRSGDASGAKRAFGEALRLRPGYPEGLNNYAVLLASMGELDRALETFEKAVSEDPGYADAYLNRAVVLENAGMTEEAVEAYRGYLRTGKDTDMQTRVRRKIAELRAGMIMDKTVK